MTSPLFDQLRSNPDDADAWQVLADSLPPRDQLEELDLSRFGLQRDAFEGEARD